MVQPRPAVVSIMADGSVMVTTAGMEMGQGMFTKVKQVWACLQPNWRIAWILLDSLLWSTGPAMIVPLHLEEWVLSEAHRNDKFMQATMLLRAGGNP